MKSLGFTSWDSVSHIVCIHIHSWNTLGWPGKISDQVESTDTQMDQDNQKFQKKLSDDQQQLEDRLDTLQLTVAGFSGRTDIGKAAETANEVRRVTKELKDCQQQASLYNQRERLFGMAVTQYDKVGFLILKLSHCEFFFPEITNSQNAKS